MAHVDLHLHTTFSDGTLTPEQLVAAAAERGVTLIAVTDHDEIGGVAPAQAAGISLGVEVLSGVEINTEVGREDVHILGYGFPADSSVLLDGLREFSLARERRAQAMVERLNVLGYPIKFSRVMEIAGEGTVGRPHVGRALVEAGFVADLGQAFDRLIGSGCPAYIPREHTEPEDAIKLIQRAGGVASLAHPGKLGDPLRFILRLKEAGLDALEAYHSDHSAKVTDRLLKWARQYGLSVTGGTDSHGPNGPRVTPIGTVPVPDEIGAQLKALIQKRQKA